MRVLVSEAQQLFASAGYYKFAIDNDFEVESAKSVVAIEKAGKYKVSSRWGWQRRMIAAVQYLLNSKNFEAGVVDGLVGHNTRNALDGWLYFNIHGKREIVERTPVPYAPSSKVYIPTQAECTAFYGQPGSAAIEAEMILVQLPFKLRIDYNLKQSTSRMRVHKKVAPHLERAMLQVYNKYGPDRMKDLGIDRYAGGFNPRRMRNGSAWSMHAYGCAVDFYAAPNGLRVSCPQALFCKPEYKDFLDIMEENNMLPAIRLWKKDAMHFQMCRL